MPRGRKPSVGYEKRHEWLERYRRGVSPPSIAKSDGFDVRTVRKNIDLARQEVEGGDARTMVYRDALQEHYRDLCGFAAKMDTAVAAEETVNEALDERMWSALRQHIPSSVIWRSLDRWSKLLRQRDEDRKVLKENIRVILENDADILERFAGRAILIEGLVQAMVSQANQRANGLPGLDATRNIYVEPTGDILTGRYGNFGLGPVTEEEMGTIRKIVQRLEPELVTRDLHSGLQKTEEEIRRLKHELQDNLAVITLRRVVPGSCRYCPI